MEKPDNQTEDQALALAIEENRLRMYAAWIKAKGSGGAIDSDKQNLDNARSRHFARKKKSG